MLIFNLSNRKTTPPAPVVTHTSSTAYATPSRQADFLHREEVIRKLAASLPYKIGDKVEITVSTSDNPQDWVVLDVVEHYWEYPVTLEYPENDNPYLVRIYQEATKTATWCTTNYIKKVME